MLRVGKSDDDLGIVRLTDELSEVLLVDVLQPTVSMDLFDQGAVRMWSYHPDKAIAPGIFHELFSNQYCWIRGVKCPKCQVAYPVLTNYP